MGQEQKDNGQFSDKRHLPAKKNGYLQDDFVLEKSIFVHIFEKDIRRVFIYKKAERLAKAVHLIAPAFTESASLRNRIDGIAIGLVDAAVLPQGAARATLARELLALSSMLSIARTSGLLSTMNAELIAHEAHTLLQEIAVYEEPRLFLDEAPTLSGIARTAGHYAHDAHRDERTARRQPAMSSAPNTGGKSSQGHIKDISDARTKDRREGVLSVIRNKGQASIKDISTVIRGVSEKTIQRELQALTEAGLVVKRGERRWSTYSLV